MASASSPANGLSLGMIAAKSLKNSKLSVETGLGYSFIQQPLSVVVNIPGGNTAAQEMDNLIVYGTSSSTFKSADADAYQSQTRFSQGLNLHYATIPVQFSFRIGNRFSAKAGLETGLLLTSQSDFTKGGLFDDSTIELSDPALSSASSFKVSFFDLAAIGGIGFQVSPEFSLQVGYKFGVLDVLPNNQSDDFNRLLHASVQYNLKGRR